GREFVFEFGRAHRVAAVALAEVDDCLGRELLLAFEPDAGACGEAEDVFGLDLVESLCLVRVRGHAREQRDDGDRRAADPRLATSSHLVPPLLCAPRAHLRDTCLPSRRARVNEANKHYNCSNSIKSRRGHYDACPDIITFLNKLGRGLRITCRRAAAPRHGAAPPPPHRLGGRPRRRARAPAAARAARGRL